MKSGDCDNMARRVFFSFHYEKDINRSMVVRNSWLIPGKEAVGFVDKAEFESIKKQGERAVRNWIDQQLQGTSVTVVLIGAETLERPFVQYEIRQSIKKGSAVLGVFIHNIKDMKSEETSEKGDIHTVIGYRANGNPVYFDEICDGVYDYCLNKGYKNLGNWIEDAVCSKEKGTQTSQI